MLQRGQNCPVSYLQKFWGALISLEALCFLCKSFQQELSLDILVHFLQTLELVCPTQMNFLDFLFVNDLVGIRLAMLHCKLCYDAADHKRFRWTFSLNLIFCC